MSYLKYLVQLIYPFSRRSILIWLDTKWTSFLHLRSQNTCKYFLFPCMNQQATSTLSRFQNLWRSRFFFSVNLFQFGSLLKQLFTFLLSHHVVTCVYCLQLTHHTQFSLIIQSGHKSMKTWYMCRMLTTTL